MLGLVMSQLPDHFLLNKLHQPRYTGIQQLNINIIWSIIKSTRCYTKFDKCQNYLDSRHSPQAPDLSLLVGPYIEISVLVPLNWVHHPFNHGIDGGGECILKSSTVCHVCAFTLNKIM